MIFSQRHPYLLDLIAQKFGLKVNARFRTDKLKPAWEYTVETRHCTTLVPLFEHFHTYPLQGIKHGHMFLTLEALIVKNRLFKLRNSKKLQATTIRKAFFHNFFTCRENLVVKNDV